jgi:hypothetical protein
VTSAGQPAIIKPAHAVVFGQVPAISAASSSNRSPQYHRQLFGISRLDERIDCPIFQRRYSSAERLLSDFCGIA